MTKSSHYHQQIITVGSAGRGTTSITHLLNDSVAKAAIANGLCHVFIHHTSASLIICENADPDVRLDLETFMSALVPDGDAMFTHTCEGMDDMPAHVRSILTQTELTVPIVNQTLALGAWQGVYLWEHRHASHKRRLTITVHGIKAPD